MCAVPVPGTTHDSIHLSRCGRFQHQDCRIVVSNGPRRHWFCFKPLDTILFHFKGSLYPIFEDFEKKAHNNLLSD